MNKVEKRDIHLNLFYSYSGGNRDDLDKCSQLEDNITRSFLITLMHLQTKNRNIFLKALIGAFKHEIKTDKLNFDLQSIDNKSDLSKISNVPKKILLTIGRQVSDIKKSDLAIIDVDKGLINKINKLDEKAKGKKEEEIKKKYKQMVKKQMFDEEFQISGDEEKIHGKYLQSLYSLIHGSRPDGWIYNDDIAILIEAKSGFGKIYDSQIFRHLTDPNGFGIPSKEVLKGDGCDKYDIVNISWKEINEKLYKLELNDNEKIFVHQFKEYLIMTGETLDLSFVVKEDEGYDREKAKNQFPLFLEELDREVEKLGIKNLERGKRPLDILWDYYGIKTIDKSGKKSINKNPHYSIYFDQPGLTNAGITLTTTTMKTTQIKKLFNLPKFNEYLKDKIKLKKEAKISRYYIMLQNYRIIDHIKGQQKGETNYTFMFKINFSEISSDKDIDVILDSMKQYVNFAKEFAFGIEILYPDVSKIRNKDQEGLRQLNKALFEDHEKLIKLYCEFIQDTKSIFESLIQ